MTVQQLRKMFQELREEAAKSNLCWLDSSKYEAEAPKVREEIIKEIEETKAKMQYYIDGGVFEDEDRFVNMEWSPDNLPIITIDLIQGWKNRHSMTIKEKSKLYQDLGFFRSN